jgi:hypothetical protein
MSVFSVPRPRLPDQITVEFGPPDILGRAFLNLDRTVRERGIYLSVSHDLEELAEVNARNRKDWYPLPPMFDTTLGGITPENAFWMCGVNDKGEVVLTHSGRLYFWPHTSLTDEFESMRFFYPDPERQKSPGEACIVETEAAREISGRVCYTGALWFRPDYRGLGLASILPRLSRAYALTKWYPDFMLSMAKNALMERGMARTYGWSNVDTGVRWLGSREGGAQLEFSLGWLDQQETVNDLERFALPSANTLGALRV